MSRDIREYVSSALKTVLGPPKQSPDRRIWIGAAPHHVQATCVLNTSLNAGSSRPGRSDSRERQPACVEFGGLDDLAVTKFPDNASSRYPLGVEVMDDRGSVDAITDCDLANRETTSIEFREGPILHRG